MDIQNIQSLFNFTRPVGTSEFVFFCFLATLYSGILLVVIYQLNVDWHQRRKGMTKEQRKAEDDALKNMAIYNMDMTHYEPNGKAER